MRRTGTTMEFKEGDLVQFIAGGPVMVVFYVNKTDATAPIGCKYWAGASFELADFAPDHLQKIKRCIVQNQNGQSVAMFELDVQVSQTEPDGKVFRFNSES